MHPERLPLLIFGLTTTMARLCPLVTAGTLADQQMRFDAELRAGGIPSDDFSAQRGEAFFKSTHGRGAYPPALRPASTWRRIMSRLDRHFGVDASVDPVAGAEIARYLERYAGTERRTTASADSLWLTETRWFSHKHGEVPASVWRLPAVKSASNCAACHAGAEQGDFRHHNIRIPR